jgi:hypothetical protein
MACVVTLGREPSVSVQLIRRVLSMRIEKLYVHHIFCVQEYCERDYCRTHRLIFNRCLGAESYMGSLHGGGECPRCRYEAKWRAA